MSFPRYGYQVLLNDPRHNGSAPMTTGYIAVRDLVLIGTRAGTDGLISWRCETPPQ